jgi:conjugal transfer/entry exclusion protein
MTLLGKIFTVLIFIMSLVFASFAVAVYATHKNWKDEVLRKPEDTKSGQEIGKKFQLQASEERNERLSEEKRKLEDQLAMEQAARRQALAALEARARSLAGQLAALQARNAVLTQNHREAITQVAVAEESAVAIKDEVVGLRARNSTVQHDRDSLLVKVRELTDNMHMARSVRANLEERRNQLADELSKRKQVMDRHGISADEPADATPPKIEGVVTAVSKTGLLEVSIGSDDGLAAGHTLEVFDGKSYAGRVSVIKTTPNRSVAKIIQEYQKRDIKKGDNVATRLGNK